MRKTEKIVVLAVLVAGFVLSGYAGVIAAWNFKDNVPAITAGWTDFVSEPNNSVTVHFTGDEFWGDGGITLSQGAEIYIDARNLVADAIDTSATPLLAAGKNELNDGFLVGKEKPLVFALSGLVEKQTYRLQFIGVIRHDLGVAAKRNLMMTVNGATAKLFASPVAIKQDSAGYSEYVSFTADYSGCVVVTFKSYGAGIRRVSGLIVETVADLPVQGRPRSQDHKKKTLGLITAGL